MNLGDLQPDLISNPPGMPVLTPENIVQPLPQITQNAIPPVPVSGQCDWWSELNGAIAQNPGMAVLILAGATYLLWRKR